MVGSFDFGWDNCDHVDCDPHSILSGASDHRCQVVILMASQAVATNSSSSTESSSLTSTHMPLKILVIGAGIAGLSAAIGLRRAGHDVEVMPFLLEKASNGTCLL